MKATKEYIGQLEKFELSPNCLGFSEKVKLCWNFTIISTEPTVGAFYNDYLAGYVQGKLQGEDMIKASRNNSWSNAYLCKVGHTENSIPKQLPPSDKEFKKVYNILKTNYRYLINWLDSNVTHEAYNISRSLYRMIGVYHGAISKDICIETDLLNLIKGEDLFAESGRLSYGDRPLSFEDIYFINVQLDLWDVIFTSEKVPCKLDNCTAFFKRSRGDILWAHNSWSGYLAQSHVINYVVRNDNNDENERENIDFVSQSSYYPGQIGSNMGYGFNGHGICFNKTIYCYSKKKIKIEGIWLFWRATAAEIFAQSIDDFYNHITLDNTGNSLGGHMLIDVNTKEIALIEMSYKRFVLFRAKKNDKEYSVTEEVDMKKVTLTKDDYNPDLLCKHYILGINYPISYNVAKDISSKNRHTKKRIQLKDRIWDVNCQTKAKNLITHGEGGDPLSIFGRCDIRPKNIGEYGKTIPSGTIDAKVFSANKVRDLLNNLKFTPNKKSKKTAFWIVYGTALVNGNPFTWSLSKWKEYKQATEKDFVPDRLRGNWFRSKLFID